MTVECTEKLKDENGEVVECGKACEPRAIVQFHSLKWVCPDGHEQVLKKKGGVKKVGRICDTCAREGHEEYLIHMDTGLHSNPPQVGHDYYLKCLKCSSEWIEEVSMQKRDAYRFRKEPQLKAEVA